MRRVLVSALSHHRDPTTVFDRAAIVLTDADCNPIQLAESLAELQPHVYTLDPEARLHWLCALREKWGQYREASDQHRLTTSEVDPFLDLATALCDWPLVRSIGEWLVEQDLAASKQHLTLATADWHLGDNLTGLERCRRVMLAEPFEQAAESLYEAMVEWHRFVAQFPFHGSELVDDGEIRLELLGTHHMGDFYWQYSDPDIAELCHLPTFHADEDWYTWLADVYDIGDQLPFAVIHRDWGFAGVVNLVLHDEVGFFYYWIGADFQGHGLGPRAVDLLLQVADEFWGLHTCYAKVYPSNTRSQRGLDKLGFERLDIPAMGSNGEELVYRRGQPRTRVECIADLRRLFDQMESETRLAIPLAA